MRQLIFIHFSCFNLESSLTFCFETHSAAQQWSTFVPVAAPPGTGRVTGLPGHALPHLAAEAWQSFFRRLNCSTAINMVSAELMSRPSWAAPAQPGSALCLGVSAATGKAMIEGRDL